MKNLARKSDYNLGRFIVNEDTLYRHELEQLVIDKFVECDDISVICDGKLADKLLQSVYKQKFKNKYIDEIESDQEYIVSKALGNLICEYAKNENGDYILVDSVIVITVDGLEKLNTDYEFIQEIWDLKTMSFEEATMNFYKDNNIEFGS